MGSSRFQPLVTLIDVSGVQVFSVLEEGSLEVNPLERVAPLLLTTYYLLLHAITDTTTNTTTTIITTTATTTTATLRGPLT